MNHEGQSRILDSLFGYRIQENEAGLQGIIDKDDKEVLPSLYNKVEILPYGFACLHSRRKLDREKPWIDLLNGIRFHRQPHIERKGNLDFSTTNGKILYPRVLTRKMNEKLGVNPDDLNSGINNGLRFYKFLVLSTEPQKLYESIDKMDNMELFEDERGKTYYTNYTKTGQISLVSITRSEWDAKKAEWQDETQAFENKRKWILSHQSLDEEVKGVLNERDNLKNTLSLLHYDIEKTSQGKFTLYRNVKITNKWACMGTWLSINHTKYGIFIVQNSNRKFQLLDMYGQPFKSLNHEYDNIEALDHGFFRLEDAGKTQYLGLETRKWHKSLPRLVKIGFLEFWQEDDLFYMRGKDDLAGYPYRRNEIREGNGICFVGSNSILIEGRSQVFHISQKTRNGRKYLVHYRSSNGNTVYMELQYDGVKLRIRPI